MKRIKLLVGVLIVVQTTLAQNVGINTTTPQATLDVNGTTLVRGAFEAQGVTILKGANVNSITPANNRAGVEFFGGRASTGIRVDPSMNYSDLGFNWAGPGGGFRHFIATRHDNVPNSSTNAFDFYLNNSTSFAGSGMNYLGPAGAKHMMSITANGVGIGTISPSAKLHVVGNFLLKDGTQGAGKILTSDANGAATWTDLFSTGVFPWTRDEATGTTYLTNNTDNVGIGTTTPTQTLDVNGQIRIRGGGGSLRTGTVLTSDINGVGSWEYPEWTTGGSSSGKIILKPFQYNRMVAIGFGVEGPPLNIHNQVNLHVNGGLRLDGPNTGTIAEGNVLTLNAAGNAVWKSLLNTNSSPWIQGTNAVWGSVTKTNPTTNDQPYLSNAQFVVSKYITGAANASDDKKSYPMVVEGSETGIAVAVNGVSNSSKKYISFFENGGLGNNTFRGAIEGQTLLELQDDPEYIAYTALQAFQGGELLAEAIACASQADLFEAIVMGVQGGIFAADLAVTVAYTEGNVGVNYSSGSADYAEWLERANPSEKFTFGDIVSVNGGKISKKITGTGQLQVISRAPIVLGNVPDENNKTNYEKVAFMGQVPVKVIGKTAVGDYIVAFENGNGMGYAVHPSKIKADEMNRIAGVAWSASGNGEISLINTAVGINTQASTHFIQKQEDEINTLKNNINQLYAYLQSKDSAFTYNKLNVDTVTKLSKIQTTSAISTKVQESPNISIARLTAYDKLKKYDALNIEKIKELITRNKKYLLATIKLMKEKIEQSGQDLNSNPQLKRLLTDETFLIENIKKIYQIK